MEHGLATLQTFSIPIIILLAPVAYLALTNNRKAFSSNKSTSNGTADSNYSKFDTSNIRVTKILIHPIKVLHHVTPVFYLLDGSIRASVARMTESGVLSGRIITSS